MANSLEDGELAISTDEETESDSEPEVEVVEENEEEEPSKKRKHLSGYHLFMQSNSVSYYFHLSIRISALLNFFIKGSGGG